MTKVPEMSILKWRAQVDVLLDKHVGGANKNWVCCFVFNTGAASTKKSMQPSSLKKMNRLRSSLRKVTNFFPCTLLWSCVWEVSIRRGGGGGEISKLSGVPLYCTVKKIYCEEVFCHAQKSLEGLDSHHRHHKAIETRELSSHYGRYDVIIIMFVRCPLWFWHVHYAVHYPGITLHLLILVFFFCCCCCCCCYYSGEKLSKQQLQSNNIVKKLRSKEKESDALIKKQRYCTVLCIAVLTTVLCCAVLCCAVLCCAVLCCAVLCCTVESCTSLCNM